MRIICLLKKHKIGCPAYKYVNNNLLYELPYPPFTNSIAPYPLRTHKHFRLPLCANLHTRSAITYRSAKIWNSLPDFIKNTSSLSTFKKHLQTFMKNNQL